MAGDHCHKVTAGIGISLLYSIFSAMDLFAILYIAFSVDELTEQKIECYCRYFACWALSEKSFASIRFQNVFPAQVTMCFMKDDWKQENN